MHFPSCLPSIAWVISVAGGSQNRVSVCGWCVRIPPRFSLCILHRHCQRHRVCPCCLRQEVYCSPRLEFQVFSFKQKTPKTTQRLKLEVENATRKQVAGVDSGRHRGLDCPSFPDFNIVFTGSFAACVYGTFRKMCQIHACSRVV